jgi:DNA-binding response OmpR family regulator
MNPDNPTESQAAPRVLVVCDQSDTAPIWGYIIREKGLIAILETSVQRALTRLAEANPDLVIVDVNAPHPERLELCKKFRATSDSPLLLFLPASNEMEILDAYQAGVDECVIKPVSPAVFLAKILAWARRGRMVSGGAPSPARSITLRLDPARRAAVTPDRQEVKLTNLEFRLLRLLMSRPGYVFPTNEIIQSVWGSQGESDAALLKNVVYRLRKKLGSDAGEPYFIQTWPGGYSFQEG